MEYVIIDQFEWLCAPVHTSLLLNEYQSEEGKLSFAPGAQKSGSLVKLLFPLFISLFHYLLNNSLSPGLLFFVGFSFKL